MLPQVLTTVACFRATIDVVVASNIGLASGSEPTSSLRGSNLGSNVWSKQSRSSLSEYLNQLIRLILFLFSLLSAETYPVVCVV